MGLNYPETTSPASISTTSRTAPRRALKKVRRQVRSTANSRPVGPAGLVRPRNVRRRAPSMARRLGSPLIHRRKNLKNTRDRALRLGKRRRVSRASLIPLPRDRARRRTNVPVRKLPVRALSRAVTRTAIAWAKTATAPARIAIAWGRIATEPVRTVIVQVRTEKASRAPPRAAPPQHPRAARSI